MNGKYAYIFDFDGVLFYSMEGHYRCYKQALEEFGVQIDKAQFYSQAGMTGVEQIAYFAGKAGIDLDPRDVYRRKGEIQKEHVPVADPIECNVELLRMLQESGNPVAIGSGSSKPAILPILEKHGIKIDIVITSEDVERGKPNPDLFLEAARRLDMEPDRCIVIEDSDAGIEAAKAAGMSVFRYYDINKKEGI